MLIPIKYECTHLYIIDHLNLDKFTVTHIVVSQNLWHSILNCLGDTFYLLFRCICSVISIQFSRYFQVLLLKTSGFPRESLFPRRQVNKKNLRRNTTHRIPNSCIIFRLLLIFSGWKKLMSNFFFVIQTKYIFIYCYLLTRVSFSISFNHITFDLSFEMCLIDIPWTLTQLTALISLYRQPK